MIIMQRGIVHSIVSALGRFVTPREFFFVDGDSRVFHLRHYISGLPPRLYLDDDEPPTFQHAANTYGHIRVTQLECRVVPDRPGVTLDGVALTPGLSVHLRHGATLCWARQCLQLRIPLYQEYQALVRRCEYCARVEK